jgi:hypothetical protein
VLEELELGFVFLMLFVNLWQWQGWQWWVLQRTMTFFTPHGMSLMFSLIFGDVHGCVLLELY